MSLDEYLEAAHVRVSVLDSTHDSIDAALATRGLRRKVVLTVSHFSVVPLVVAETGYVATLSRKLGDVYAPQLSLDLREPPLDLDDRNVQMIWHERSERDEGCRFFRGVVTDASRDGKRRVAQGRRARDPRRHR